MQGQLHVSKDSRVPAETVLYRVPHVSSPVPSPLMHRSTPDSVSPRNAKQSISNIKSLTNAEVQDKDGSMVAMVAAQLSCLQVSESGLCKE